MKTVYYPAESRALTKTAWLTSRHSFNFNNHYDPERTGFGALVVLNDDIIAPGRGFGTHPHKEMEIVSIVLKGSLEHKDSTGGTGVLKTGDIQAMTAGTGVFHSEFNPSATAPGEFLQLWILPQKAGLKPRYDQRAFGIPEGLQEIVSGHETGMLAINADASIRLGKVARGEQLDERLAAGHGAYAFVIEGSMRIAGKELGPRDAIGVSGTRAYKIEALTDATLLLIDVAMQ